MPKSRSQKFPSSMPSEEEVPCKRDQTDIPHGRVASHASVSASDVLSTGGMQVYSGSGKWNSSNKGYNHRHFPTRPSSDHQCWSISFTLPSLVRRLFPTATDRSTSESLVVPVSSTNHPLFPQLLAAQHGRRPKKTSIRLSIRPLR